MLRSLKELKGYSILAVDENLGSIRDILIDEETWGVRYAVATTGPWLLGKRVLIIWPALGRPDWQMRQFPVALSKEQIQNAPSVDTDAPVSRRMEQRLHVHYAWNPYWPATPVPMNVVDEKDEDEDEIHLRSMVEVLNYQIEASDGKLGHVEDFIADDEGWIVRYLVIDTRNLLPGGKKVLISPGWVKSINWSTGTVAVDLTRGQIEAAPEYDPSQPVNRHYETRLFDYYGRPHYW